MTEDEKVLMEITNAVRELPPSDRVVVESIARTLRILIQADQRAIMAISLIGAELVAQ
jgi:hypothetical protein